VEVLEQTGLASRAGVAILVKAGAGWDVLHKQVLIPGYAVIVKVSHRISRESFWVLSVYGDISQGQVSLNKFLGRLRTRLTALIRREAKTHWGGCFAIGDWNFVEHAGDRHPVGSTQNPQKKLISCFEDIKKLCSMKDVAGRGPAPRDWSYSKMTHNGMVYSRLDRVYRPSLGWRSGKVLPMTTKWSDHRVVIATVYVTAPKVEKASPAPRLPSIEVLEKVHRFWPGVLRSWEELTGAGPVTLEMWSSFKEEVLRIGKDEVKAMKKIGRKDWVEALRREHMAPGDILDAVARANGMLWAKRGPPARAIPSWPTAIPAYEIVPVRRKGFVPSTASPWQVPVLTRAPPLSDAPSEARDFLVPKLRKGVATLLDERSERFAAAAKAKWEKMTKTHSSEWFKQSSNKELDERGSQASVSVEGLRRHNEALAHTSLTEMASVAKDYFFHLHTPEPSPPDRIMAQHALLDDVRRQSQNRPGPDPEEVSLGPFTVDEMKALRSKMPNTAPGPDGIHYGFWRKLMSILDGLQDSMPPPRTFWSVFADITSNIALRGSSRAGFKDANISLFYKKGDPTLVSNYRPISSMNTDCKMYTNLLNNRLAPWAVAKLHPDQKGFVPGRLMNKHTRLAVEVAHLCDATETPGFIVGLDQAKAYDRVDQSWLMSVLRAFGLPGELVLLIDDLTLGCRSRVRINSGYSPYFTLRRGVRQGDPLSCLLFNFSIEPLAIKL